MFKILDKYILKKLMGTFFVTISMFTLIAIVFDISEKIDDFLRDDITLNQIIFDYYLSFAPWLYSLLAPLLIFISVIFFTSKMASKTEIIPILASGVSFGRFLRPYIIGSIFLTLLSLLMSHYIIPNTSKKKVDFEAIIYNHDAKIDNSDLHKEIRPNHFISLRTYSKKSDIGYNFNYDIIEDGKLKARFSAGTIKWDFDRSRWVARNWYNRVIDGEKEILTQGASIDTTFNFDYKEFHKRPSMIATMDYFEISDYIAEETAKGSDYIKVYELEQVKRTAIPFSIIVLTIIGASISCRKAKGGIGIHIAYGLALASTYVFLGKIGEVFAINTPISATVAVWIPNVIYAGIALFLYKKAPK